VSPLPTLVAMSEGTEIFSPMRSVELGPATRGDPLVAVEAQASYGAEAQEVVILPILVRVTVIVLIAAVVIVRIAVAFGVGEFKALWAHGRRSHTE
jgi:hypothetical protein